MRCDPTISVFYSLHIILYCTIFTIPILFKNNGYTVNNTFNVYAIAEPVEFTLINIKNNTVDYTLTYLSEYNNISYNETVFSNDFNNTIILNVYDSYYINYGSNNTILLETYTNITTNSRYFNNPVTPKWVIIILGIIFVFIYIIFCICYIGSPAECKECICSTDWKVQYLTILLLFYVIFFPIMFTFITQPSLIIHNNNEYVYNNFIVSTTTTTTLKTTSVPLTTTVLMTTLINSTTSTIIVNSSVNYFTIVLSVCMILIVVVLIIIAVILRHKNKSPNVVYLNNPDIVLNNLPPYSVN